MDKDDDISTTVVGGDTTVVGGDEGVDDAGTARPSSWASMSSGSVAVRSLPPHDRQLSQLVALQSAAKLFWTNSTTSGRHHLLLPLEAALQLT